MLAPDRTCKRLADAIFGNASATVLPYRLCYRIFLVFRFIYAGPIRNRSSPFRCENFLNNLVLGECYPLYQCCKLLTSLALRLALYPLDDPRVGGRLTFGRYSYYSPSLQLAAGCLGESA